MPFEAESFSQLCVKITSIDLSGTKAPPPPWGAKTPTAADLIAALKEGGAVLPPAYQTGYVKPLQDQIPRLMHFAQSSPAFVGHLETLFGAVHQHSMDHSHSQPLRRFMAVVSDLYRSFLSEKKRVAAGVQPSEVLPPLATFKYRGDDGPFTLPVDDTEQVFGSSIGVVSMPAVYSDHPLLWGSLAHETGGHDVVHAEEGMLAELQGAVAKRFGADKLVQTTRLSADEFTGLLWAYWMDEAAADVYGLLNMGPAFAFNLAALLSGVRGGGKGGGPQLQMQSGPSDLLHGNLDPHPTDILRMGLAMGVIDSLSGLSQKTRTEYTSSLQQVVDICAGSNKDVRIDGFITLGPLHVLIQSSQPLKDMMKSARIVGKLIATAKLDALNGNGIQRLESWDDGDEQVATRIEAAFVAGRPVIALGDDAQLLAGLTLAASRFPKRYDEFTKAANDALDASYADDPVFGVPSVDRAFIAYKPMKLDGSQAIPVAAPARKKANR
jgi:hypothetical protein